MSTEKSFGEQWREVLDNTIRTSTSKRYREAKAQNAAIDKNEIGMSPLASVKSYPTYTENAAIIAFHENPANKSQIEENDKLTSGGRKFRRKSSKRGSKKSKGGKKRRTNKRR